MVKLFPHQVEALDAVKGFNNAAFYLDMGLGKTFVGSEKMMAFGNKVNLIVCQKSKVNDWIDHCTSHTPMWCLDLTKKKDFSLFMAYLAEGSPFNKDFIGVINYELAWRRPQLKTLTDFTLMLDESSLIQNKTAKQTKFILSLQPKNVILLSGTPTSGKYENLWTQAHLLGWSITEDLFNKHYVNWVTIESDGFFHRVVDMDNPYKNIDRLKQKFRAYGAVFMKTEDVFDLPPQTFTTLRIPTTKDYRKFMKDSIIQLADGTELIGDQAFTKRLYARQLCGMYNQAKLDAFRDLIASTNDRVIVFYNFKLELAELQCIAWELNRPCSWVCGDKRDLEAYEDADNSVTFIQYQAGSMGLNLQKANKMIYFTLPERSDLFEQSKARIHRIGQQRPCFYWILQCEKSVEELIYQALQQRKDFTDELFIEGGMG